ncbi:MAG: hypothetical protein AABY18_08860 [Candidatus Thermoplasmatota archaeon]
MPNVDLRPRPQRTPHSPLWHLNAVLARPLAALFGLLGVAPGQLSLQSVTLTAVGLLRAAGGDWAHLVQGALIVYVAMLLDRADDLLAQSKSVTAWGRFLGLMADRLIEVALVVALGWFALTTDAGTWPLASTTFLLVLAVLVSAMLLARLAAAYGDLLILRMHLAGTRRLPGPSAIPREGQASPLLSRLFDRDFFVAVWVVGVIAQQLAPTAFVLLGAQAIVVIEGFVLFWSRRKDPEPHAAHVLNRGP